MIIIVISTTSFQVGKYWPKEVRKMHIEQAKEQRHRKQLAVLQSKLEQAQSSSPISSHSPNNTHLTKHVSLQNSTSFSGENIIANSNSNSISSPNQSFDSSSNGRERQHHQHNQGDLMGQSFNANASAKSPTSTKFLNHNPPPKSHSMEPILLSVTTV